MVPCPGNWDGTKDCAECVGNWDPEQDCAACRNHWEGANCDTCPGNWDPAQDCGACVNHWAGTDCDICPPFWDPSAECNACLGNYLPDMDCQVCAIFVDVNASPGGQGTSWEDAIDNIQGAITGATASGCEVWVAAGIYFVYVDARENTIAMQPNVKMYGGCRF